MEKIENETWFHCKTHGRITPEYVTTGFTGAVLCTKCLSDFFNEAIGSVRFGSVIEAEAARKKQAEDKADEARAKQAAETTAKIADEEATKAQEKAAEAVLAAKQKDAEAKEAASKL